MDFSTAVFRFRSLAEAFLPGGKLVKKSQISKPQDPSWDPSKHLARSVPKAAEKLKSVRKMIGK